MGITLLYFLRIQAKPERRMLVILLTVRQINQSTSENVIFFGESNKNNSFNVNAQLNSDFEL